MKSIVLKTRFYQFLQKLIGSFYPFDPISRAALILSLGSFLLVFSTYGQEPNEVYQVETVPNPKDGGRGYVSDPSAFISALDLVQINQIVAAIEDSTTAQIAVVVLPSIGTSNPKVFATNLFNSWGIGQANKDNGLLILSVMDQRRTEFETGYGMEAVLTDAQCYRIGMQRLVPHFKEGAYGAGLVAALEGIQEVLYNPDAQEDLVDRGKRVGYEGIIPGIPLGLEIYLFIALIVGGMIALMSYLALHNKDDLYDKYLKIRNYKVLILVFIFPLPYFIIYFVLGGLLRRLRNQTRFSKINGKKMHKLDESEEDQFLEQGQIAEEYVKSVDYDVWVTEDLDDILILKYLQPFSKYSHCPECGFRTYHHQRTETIRAATYSHSGQQAKFHSCKNCHYQHTTYQIIPRKVRSSGGGGGGSGGGSGSWGGGSSGGGGAGVSW